jgi:hypothetical protein
MGWLVRHMGIQVINYDYENPEKPPLEEIFRGEPEPVETSL